MRSPKLPYRQILLLLLLYLGWAVCLTWPLMTRITTHLPLGTEQSDTVPLFNLWTLRWNADRLAVGYADYWDAPIFYPTAGTFALSEPQPLTGLVFAPLQGITGNVVLAYNLVLLLVLMLNGAAAYLLAHYLDVPAVPALLMGLFAAALPFVSNEFGVLQLTVIAPLLVVWAGLVVWFDRQQVWAIAMVGGGVAAAFLTCGYYGLFLTLFLPLGGLVLLRRAWFQPAHWRVGLVVLVVMGSLLGPVLVGQRHYTQTYTRATSTIRTNSAQLPDYLRLPSTSWGDGVLPWLATAGGSGQKLYPGTGVLVLAILGAAAGWSTRWRRWVLFCLLGMGAAFIFSLGYNLQISSWYPYDLIRETLPGFQQLRSPFRLALMGQLCLLGLLPLGLAWLWGRSRWLVAVVVVLGLLELLPLPARLTPFPQAEMSAPWVAWLAGQPDGAVVMIPLPVSGRARDYQSTLIAMHQEFIHGHPLVNGYSGFFPAAYGQLHREMAEFPFAGWCSLTRLDVAYLVISRDWLTLEREARLAQDLGLSPPLFQDATTVIYAIPAYLDC